MAVVFAILLVAANAMMMNQRERTSEVAVLKTIGFSDRAVFALVIVEAAVIALVGRGARPWASPATLPLATNFNAVGFLPGFHVTSGTLRSSAPPSRCC